MFCMFVSDKTTASNRKKARCLLNHFVRGRNHDCFQNFIPFITYPDLTKKTLQFLLKKNH